MGCPVFRGSLALDGGLLLPRSDRGPLRGPRCLPHGSARVLALLGDGDRLPREAHLLRAALRSRRPESLFEPALTIYSVHSGKDESCAKTRDNGGVQTFVPGRARECGVRTWPAPSAAEPASRPCAASAPSTAPSDRGPAPPCCVTYSHP